MKRAFLLFAFTFLISPAFGHPGGHGDPGKGEYDLPFPVKQGPAPVGEPPIVSRAIAIEMSDPGRCNPATVEVKAGETVKFVARNATKLPLDFSIGSASELKEQAEMLGKFPQMQTPGSTRARAKPGQAAELVKRFTQSGELAYSCAAPGQYVAGAVGRLVVRP